MIYVVMRDGLVIQYNDGGSIRVEDGGYAIRTRGETSLIARVPCELVARVEFDPPCRVMTETEYCGSVTTTNAKRRKAAQRTRRVRPTKR